MSFTDSVATLNFAVFTTRTGTLNRSIRGLTTCSASTYNDIIVISRDMEPVETGESEKRRRISPARRRCELMDATRAVVERYGYSGGSVPRIVETAGTSQGNFYRHFQNFDDAFLAIVSETLEPISVAASSLDFSHVERIEDVERELCAFYRALARLLQTDGLLLREVLLVGPALRGKTGDAIRAFLAEVRGVAEALVERHVGQPPFRSDISPAIAAGATVGMIVGAVQEAALWGETFDPERWAVEMARFETGALVDPAAYSKMTNDEERL